VGYGEPALRARSGGGGGQRETGNQQWAPSQGPGARVPRPPALFRRHPLRLVIEAGTAAAALCLVLGLVAMVAAPGRSTGRAAAAPAVAGLARGPGGTAETGAGQRVLVAVHGAGTTHPQTFRLLAPAAWGLAWSFSCQRGSRRSWFTARAWLATGTRPVAVAAGGGSGYGTAWTRGQSGRLVLTVTAGCPWTVKIINVGTR
jgi:hypothetical protein